MKMENTFVKRHVDILSDPRTFAVIQRGQYGRDAIDAAAAIGQVHPRIDGSTVLGSGQMQQSRQGLRGHVIARQVDARTSLAEAGNRTHDNARIDCLKGIVGQAVFS